MVRTTLTAGIDFRLGVAGVELSSRRLVIVKPRARALLSAVMLVRVTVLAQRTRVCILSPVAKITVSPFPIFLA